MVCLPGKLKV